MAKITTAFLKQEIKRLVSTNPSDFGDSGDPSVLVNRLKPWIRDEKCRLPNSKWIDTEAVEEHVEDYLKGKDSLNFDLVEVNSIFVNTNKIDFEKCWCRTFVEAEYDNYRANVITDPKDENVILIGFIGD